MTWTERNKSIVDTWGLRGSYQARAIDALHDVGRGILIAPAGSGKTIMAARAFQTLLQHLRPEEGALNLLWIANTRDQIDQAKKALELLKSQRPKFRAWIRTPAGADDIEFNRMDILIADEIHHGSCASWRRIIEACVNARWVWGMTATGHREDGEWPEVERIIGPVVCEISKDEVAADGYAIPARVEWVLAGKRNDLEEIVRSMAMDGDPSKFDVMLRKCRWSMVKQGKDFAQEVRGRVIHQAAMERVISENETRNQLAAHYCYQALCRGESCLCLVYSVAQGEAIAKAAGGALVYSKMPKRKRREHIEDFRNGEIKLLVSTSLADEGLDVPIASTLVMACGGRGMSKALGQDGKKRTTAKIEQRTARVLRAVPGKDEALIVDFFDWQHPFTLASSWTRWKGYKALGFVQRAPDEMLGDWRKRKAEIKAQGDFLR